MPNSRRRIRPAWWSLMLGAVLVAIMALCSAMFAGTFTRYIPVTLASDRSGLVMESGAKVKMRGVEVGRVAGIEGGSDPVRLKLQIFADQIAHLPANVEAQIRSTTMFGAKYVDLTYPDDPSPARLAAGAVLVSSNVSSEVNTVFENLVNLLERVDPAKLNAVISALAEGFGGQGQRMGEAIDASDEVLQRFLPLMPTVRDDWRALGEVSEVYSQSADDLLTILAAASTTAATVTSHERALDSLLLSSIGLGHAGTELLAPNLDNLVEAVNVFEPTTALLRKYSPEYTCLLVGAKFTLDNGLSAAAGGNGKSLILDSATLLGSDPYRYPANLPIVAAQGGPGGKPSCGSLPDVALNYPVRQLITNTGWGTGLDIRPNIGIGHPWWGNYLPATRAVPEPPSIRGVGPPAIGPVPYPGAPPYGAPLFGPDGTPLYPPPPGSPPAPPATNPTP